MKIVLIFALVAAVYSAPTDISDNNIGNIVKVGVHANLDQSNSLTYRGLNIEAIRRNLQAILLRLNGNGGGDDPQEPPGPEPIKISPEMVNDLINRLQQKKE